MLKVDDREAIGRKVGLTFDDDGRSTESELPWIPVWYILRESECGEVL